MKTLKPKLTKCESRAAKLCAVLNEYSGGEIAIEWRRSQMWGHNPVILFRGEKCTNIGGCGYDKKSAALASVLCFLFPHESEAFNEVAACGGAGESEVMRRLARHGWKLECTASGSSFDGYRLTKKDAE